MKHSLDFYGEIAKKSQQIQEEELAKNHNSA